MRLQSGIAILFVVTFAAPHFLSHAQTATPSGITATLIYGSSGPQVLALQRLLNTDPDTRVAERGPGSPGLETATFGGLTRAAVIRFQEKYARDVLLPVGLLRGNGRVGPYTRAKLNQLLASEQGAPPAIPPASSATATVPVSSQPADAFRVRENEKVNIYAGDAMIEAVQKRILAVINAGITSGATEAITLPTISPAEVPNVIIQSIVPRSALPGSKVTLTGNGLQTATVVHFGSEYIVRSLTVDVFGNYSFTVPPLPPARYDLAVSTFGAISNTTPFVVLEKGRPTVQVQSVTPSPTTYNSTVTVSGSGFTKENNVIITSYQKVKGVPSLDGKTMTFQIAPDVLRESARVGHGTGTVPMMLSVVNDNGFSDTEAPFIMML